MKIPLFDSWNAISRDIWHTVRYGNPNVKLGINIHFNGERIPGIESPFSRVAGWDDSDLIADQSLFFNQLCLDDQYEIIANYQTGNIMFLGKLAGRIKYQQNTTQNRLIDSVEWLDNQQVVQKIDYYGQIGQKYKERIFTAQNQWVDSYFSPAGQPVIIHYSNGTIQLNRHDLRLVFASLQDFVVWYIKRYHVDYQQFIINSLGVPYFVTKQLGFEHTFYWTEKFSGELPGNFKDLLENQQTKFGKILFRSQRELDKFTRLTTIPFDVEMIHVPFKINVREKATITNQITIATYSDELTYIEEIINQLPAWHFNIAAPTKVSNKLRKLNGLNNVTIYEGVNDNWLRNLLIQSTIFLDINPGNEVFEANRYAVEHGLVLMGYNEIDHNHDFTFADQYFDVRSYTQLVAKIATVTGYDIYQALYNQQKTIISAVSVDMYRLVFD
ncbi:hypothetical protein [Weissella paramesenteroides]|uniref:hypothetical protein n=1 Tax=Weissella paramesenteroides TaxID=1249 RepID=UPI00388EA090